MVDRTQEDIDQDARLDALEARCNAWGIDFAANHLVPRMAALEPRVATLELAFENMSLRIAALEAKVP